MITTVPEQIPNIVLFMMSLTKYSEHQSNQATPRAVCSSRKGVGKNSKKRAGTGNENEEGEEAEGEQKAKRSRGRKSYGVGESFKEYMKEKQKMINLWR